MENIGLKIPEKIKKAKILTDYAVETRYPGDYEPVTENEYKKAVKLADDVYKWVARKLESLNL